MDMGAKAARHRTRSKIRRPQPGSRRRISISHRFRNHLGQSGLRRMSGKLASAGWASTRSCAASKRAARGARALFSALGLANLRRKLNGDRPRELPWAPGDADQHRARKTATKIRISIRPARSRGGSGVAFARAGDWKLRSPRSSPTISAQDLDDIRVVQGDSDAVPDVEPEPTASPQRGAGRRGGAKHASLILREENQEGRVRNLARSRRRGY